MHYILDKDKQVVETDLKGWAEWFESNQRARIVKQHRSDTIHVSTVFLGLDHNFSGTGPPILFETMIFEDPEHPGRESYCERYTSYIDALRGHYAACRMKWGDNYGEYIDDQSR